MRSRINVRGPVVPMAAVLDRGADGWSRSRPAGTGTTQGREAGTSGDQRARSKPSRPIRTSQPNGRSRHSAGRTRPRPNSRALPHGSHGLPDCFAGSISRRACSCGARPRRWLQCWSSTSSARCAGTVCCAERSRSSHRLTCGIWTSGRRAFPKTSASPPVCCGIAVSTGRRWRCSTAACCPGSPTFTAFPFAIRAPKATALRWRRVISRTAGASTRRASSGCGSGSYTAARTPRLRPCTSCARTSRPALDRALPLDSLQPGGAA